MRLAPGDAVILARPALGGWADELPRRPWVVVPCPCGLCRQGSHVALDVPTHPALLAEDPERSPWVHVGAGALRRRGELSRELAEAWADAVCGPGLGQAFGQADGAPALHTLRLEVAALALCDVLGGLELTEQQAYQLERWRGQHGGR